MKTFNYKDGNRRYWKVTLDRYKGADKPCEFDPDDTHFGWEYAIFCEDRLVDDGLIIGQYSDPPTLSDILSQYMGMVNRAMLGFIQYGSQSTE